jgi:hypothetical protein
MNGHWTDLIPDDRMGGGLQESRAQRAFRGSGGFHFFSLGLEDMKGLNGAAAERSGRQAFRSLWSLRSFRPIDP